MSNAITCIDKWFAVKNSGISYMALIFILSNLTILHAKNSSWLQSITSYVQFFSADCYELMA